MSQTREGAIKIAAKKTGTDLNEYLLNLKLGLKRCTTCKSWKNSSDFNKDATRFDGLSPKCKECQRGIGRSRYISKPKVSRKGKRYSVRSGDKKQARAWANILVKNGSIPRPNDLPCMDCGHIYDGALRHEYDHYLGYDAEHHGDVQPVCSKCHHKREKCRNVR